MMDHKRSKNMIALGACLLLAGTIYSVHCYQQQKWEDERPPESYSFSATESELESASSEEDSPQQTAATLPPARSGNIGERRAQEPVPVAVIAASRYTRPPGGGPRHQHTFSMAIVPPPPPDGLPADFAYSTPPVAERNVPADNSRNTSLGSLIDNITLSAVIDNRAIFKINPRYRKRHGLPSAVSLGPGDEFEDLSLVTIDGENVTISEGHKRTVKMLATLR